MNEPVGIPHGYVKGRGMHPIGSLVAVALLVSADALWLWSLFSHDTLEPLATIALGTGGSSLAAVYASSTRARRLAMLSAMMIVGIFLLVLSICLVLGFRYTQLPIVGFALLYAYIFLVPAGLLLGTAVVIGNLRMPRRRQVNSTPLCEKCGYNLTGDNSGTCPQCGTPIDPAADHGIE